VAPVAAAAPSRLAPFRTLRRVMLVAMSPSPIGVDHADDGGAEQKGEETMARDYRAVKIGGAGLLT